MEIHYYGDIHSTSEHYDTTFQISSASSDLRLKGTERQSKQYHKSVHVWQNQSANITHTHKVRAMRRQLALTVRTSKRGRTDDTPGRAKKQQE